MNVFNCSIFPTATTASPPVRISSGPGATTEEPGFSIPIIRTPVFLINQLTGFGYIVRTWLRITRSLFGSSRRMVIVSVRMILAIVCPPILGRRAT